MRLLLLLFYIFCIFWKSFGDLFITFSIYDCGACRILVLVKCMHQGIWCIACETYLSSLLEKFMVCASRGSTLGSDVLKFVSLGGERWNVSSIRFWNIITISKLCNPHQNGKLSEEIVDFGKHVMISLWLKPTLLIVARFGEEVIFLNKVGDEVEEVASKK